MVFPTITLTELLALSDEDLDNLDAQGNDPVRVAIFWALYRIEQAEKAEKGGDHEQAGLKKS